MHAHFTGSVEWRGCQWDDAAQKWIVELEDIASAKRYTQSCQVLVSCVGGLTNPRKAMFPGMSSFQGVVMHTAEWDHTISFSGKRVAVIGNGGRGPCLLATNIGADITHLHSFGRSADSGVGWHTILDHTDCQGKSLQSANNSIRQSHFGYGLITYSHRHRSTLFQVRTTYYHVQRNCC